VAADGRKPNHAHISECAPQLLHLCILAVPLGWAGAAAATGAKPLVFVGSDTFQSKILATNRVGCPKATSVSIDDSGSGTATLLGRYRFVAEECINLTTFEISLGSFTLTAADGSTITGNYAGTAQLTGGTSFLYAVSGYITAGTRRFAKLTTGTVAWLGGATFTSETAATGFDTILAGDFYIAE
jgi:hypothetical protein